MLVSPKPVTVCSKSVDPFFIISYLVLSKNLPADSVHSGFLTNLYVSSTRMIPTDGSGYDNI